MNFTADELKSIQNNLVEGLTTDDIAKSLDLTRSQFETRIKNSGYRVKITRSLEAIRPVSIGGNSPLTAVAH